MAARPLLVVATLLVLLHASAATAGESSCCSGSACCGPHGQACQLDFGASGTVLDNRTGLPIAGARITVNNVVTVSSGPDGTYTASGSRAETCNIDYLVSVFVEAPGYVPFADMLYTSVPFRRVDVRLEPEDDEPLFNVTGVLAEFPGCQGRQRGERIDLQPLGRSTQTSIGADGGVFTFTGVPPGTYTLNAPSNCNPYGCWEPVTVTVADADVEVQICPQPIAILNVGYTGGPPGGSAEFVVELQSRSVDIIGLANTLAFEPETPIAARDDGTPDCRGEAGVDATFAFLPSGCQPGIDCTQVRAVVDAALPGITDGAVYRCTASVTAAPAESCFHPLHCSDLVLTAATDGPFASLCTDGGVSSRFPRQGLSFHFEMVPARPVVGDTVQLRVSAGGNGGLPQYSLAGAQPWFEGDTFPQSYSQFRPVTYDLRAAQAGIAELVMTVTYETQMGCPGMDIFGYDSDTSEPFVVEIGATEPCPIPTLTPCPLGERPNCEPGDCLTDCTCEACPACPAGEVLEERFNACNCVPELEPPGTTPTVSATPRTVTPTPTPTPTTCPRFTPCPTGQVTRCDDFLMCRCRCEACPPCGPGQSPLSTIGNSCGCVFDEDDDRGPEASSGGGGCAIDPHQPMRTTSAAMLLLPAVWLAWRRRVTRRVEGGALRRRGGGRGSAIPASQSSALQSRCNRAVH